MTIDDYHIQQLQELETAKNQIALAALLADKTPQQAVDYIENNVTNLQTAKATMKIIVRILIVILKRIPNLLD